MPLMNVVEIVIGLYITDQTVSQKYVNLSNDFLIFMQRIPEECEWTNPMRTDAIYI